MTKVPGVRTMRTKSPGARPGRAGRGGEEERRHRWGRAPGAARRGRPRTRRARGRRRRRPRRARAAAAGEDQGAALQGEAAARRGGWGRAVEGVAAPHRRVGEEEKLPRAGEGGSAPWKEAPPPWIPSARWRGRRGWWRGHRESWRRRRSTVGRGRPRGAAALQLFFESATRWVAARIRVRGHIYILPGNMGRWAGLAGRGLFWWGWRELVWWHPF